MTPVIETYSQMGNVHRAMSLWRANRLFRARTRVIRANGGTEAASNVCVIRVAKYTTRTTPVPVNRTDPTL